MNSCTIFRRMSASACVLTVLTVLAVVASASHAQFVPAGDETKMSSSSTHACAIAPGGFVKCWGSNQDRKLGNNSLASSNRPVNVLAANGVDLLSGATAISVSSTSCAIVNTAVLCWGSTLAGAAAVVTALPTVISGLEANATALSLASSRGCAVVSGGVKCWGSNTNGNLGIDPVVTPSSSVAVDVTTLGAGSGATRVAMGGNHSCAIVNGGVKCWGVNNLLGAGVTSSFSFTPVDVSGLGAGSNVVSLGISGGTTCAVSGTSFADAQMKCWGSGPVGDGSVGSQLTPVVVPHPLPGSTWGQVAPSSSSGSVCVRDNFGGLFGSIYCWGSGANGNLGRNSVSASNVPLQLPQNGLYRAVIGGGSSNCLLEDDGGARCWGANSFGQLGTRDEIEHWAPVRVFAPRCTADIDGNGSHAALTDGLMLLRVMFGLTGTAVTQGATAPLAPRMSWTEIRDHLRSECGMHLPD